MLGFATKAIDRSRTGAVGQAEVLAMMDWTPEQYIAAQACGLETMMVIRDRPMADDPRGQITTERRVYVHKLVQWLENMRALGLDAKRIGALLG